MTTRTAGFVAFGLAAVVMLCMFAGCDPSAHIMVYTPAEISAHHGLPARIPLRDVYEAREEVLMGQIRQVRAWDRNIADAEKWYSILGAVLRAGFESPEGAAAMGFLGSLPGGTILTTLLGLAAGSFLVDRPGTAKRIAKEKEASHKHGRESAVEDLTKANGAAKKA